MDLLSLLLLRRLWKRMLFCCFSWMSLQLHRMLVLQLPLRLVMSVALKALCMLSGYIRFDGGVLMMIVMSKVEEQEKINTLLAAA